MYARQKAVKTHRLPDVYLYKAQMETLVRHAVDVTLMDASNPSFHPLSNELGTSLCHLLNEINAYKPKKNFRRATSVIMYQLEMKTKRMLDDLECEIIFSTDWKFFMNHQPAREYRYAVRIKLK